MINDRSKDLQRTFDECAPLFRDTMLPEGILKKYKVGLFLREPTFCDATYKLGGFVAPHRFLIISSNARCLDEISPSPWGLCVWQTGRVFKVIDITLGFNIKMKIFYPSESVLRVLDCNPLVFVVNVHIM